MILLLDDDKSQFFMNNTGKIAKTMRRCCSRREGEAEAVCLTWAPHSRMIWEMLQGVLHVVFLLSILSERVTQKSFPFVVVGSVLVDVKVLI